MTQLYISPSDVTHINVVTPSAVLSTDPSDAVSSAVQSTVASQSPTSSQLIEIRVSIDTNLL